MGKIRRGWIPAILLGGMAVAGAVYYPRHRRIRLNRTLLEAAAARDTEAVTALLEGGADVNACSEDQFTGLMLAVGARRLDLVRTFLVHGADPERRNRIGLTALCLAARQGDTAAVDCLLQHRARLDRPDPRGATPLLIAADGGHSATVRLLLARGASRDARDSQGRTPLIAAAERGAAVCVRELLDVHADLEARDARGNTALAHAVQAAAASAEKAGPWAPFFPRPAQRVTVGSHTQCLRSVELLLARGAAPDVRDAEGRSLMLLAASAGDSETVTALLRAGAPAKGRDRYGRTALAEGIGRLDAGALTRLRASAPASREVALLAAACTNDERGVAAALAAGARLEARSSQGLSPVMLAALYNADRSIETLLARGANAEASLPEPQTMGPWPRFHPPGSAPGTTPATETILLRIAGTGSPAVIRALLAHGARVNAVGLGGTTPLMRAAAAGRPDLVRIYLEHGASTRTSDVRGHNALWWGRRFAGPPSHYHERGEVIRELYSRSFS